MNTYRYSEWDGTQSAPGFSKDELMAELGHGLMRDGDLSYLLWKMQRQDLIDGEERLTGLQKLLKRLQEEKQKRQAKYDFSSMMDVLSNKMDDIIKLEQARIQNKLKAARQSNDRQNLEKIEQLALSNLKKLKTCPLISPVKSRNCKITILRMMMPAGNSRICLNPAWNR